MQSINRLIEKSKNSHRAFTLVEMLIVVAIMAVLMSIVFRITSVGDEDSRRVTTVVRMQKLENCLSGYYAAFGSYPPVKLHGSRDIKLKVDANGDQSKNTDGDLNKKEEGEDLVWAQVRAACRSQPFGCEYPPNQEETQAIKEWSEEVKRRMESEDYPEYKDASPVFATGFTGANYSDFTPKWSKTDWKEVKLFKFGMMSFLAPRYLFMMGGNEKFFGVGMSPCAQWEDNNDLPSDPFEGDKFTGWNQVRDYTHADDGEGATKNHSDLARVVNIPSQAVCARWMPNLEGVCHTICSKEFFGINVTGEKLLQLHENYPPSPDTHEAPNGRVYKNAAITVLDGWWREYYYYSPAPYQSYSLWSAGPNGKTFPPWMALESLTPGERATALKWKNDDIIQMSH